VRICCFSFCKEDVWRGLKSWKFLSLWCFFWVQCYLGKKIKGCEVYVKQRIQGFFRCFFEPVSCGQLC
jgi:hypothetical protein